MIGQALDALVVIVGVWVGIAGLLCAGHWVTKRWFPPDPFDGVCGCLDCRWAATDRDNNNNEGDVA